MACHRSETRPVIADLTATVVYNYRLLRNDVNAIHSTLLRYLFTQYVFMPYNIDKC